MPSISTKNRNGHWKCHTPTTVSVSSKENTSTPAANGLRRKNIA